MHGGSPDIKAMAALGFGHARFGSAGRERLVFDKAPAPQLSGDRLPVIVMHELPGLDMQTINFGSRLIRSGFHVYLPLLFGSALKSNAGLNMLRCISRDFSYLRSGRHTPITDEIRCLVRDVASRHAGHRVGLIGMCLTGAFAITLIMEPEVGAAVCSQPAVPFNMLFLASGLELTSTWRTRLFADPKEVVAAADSARRSGKRVLLRSFREDRICPPERTEALARAFGACADSKVLNSPASRTGRKHPHSVFTQAYDEAPDDDIVTRRAYDDLCRFLETELG